MPLKILQRVRPRRRPTPQGLGPSFPVRDLRFDFELNQTPPHWHGAGPEVGRFLDNLSVFFPAGETFFIQSVRAFADQITDPELKAAVRDFCAQEGYHTREHRRYNRFLKAQGMPVDALEARVESILKLARATLPKRHQLAITCALEHFTALMAGHVLEDERVLAGSDPELADLWRWHSVEEAEHKAVALEVFKVAGGTYAERAAYMVLATAVFWILVADHQRRFHAADPDLRGLRPYLRVFSWNFIAPGHLRTLIVPWLAWFKPGFHPWQHDNRAELEAMIARLSASRTPHNLRATA